MPEQKIWGTDECIFKGNCVEVHLLKLRPHEGKPTCCSWHKHEYKHNEFRVLDGAIHLVVGPGLIEKSPGGEQEINQDGTRWRWQIAAGEWIVIHAGLEHRFEVTEPATVIEVVWGTSLAADIERADEGHVMEEK